MISPLSVSQIGIQENLKSVINLIYFIVILVSMLLNEHLGKVNYRIASFTSELFSR